MKRLPGCILFPIVVLLCGCAARQKPATNWRLRTGGGGQVLIPPLPLKGRAVVLRKARSVTKAGSSCDVSGSEIGLAWRGRTARIALDAKTFGPVAEVSVGDGPAPVAGTPVLDLGWWSSFGAQLEERERNGCLGTGDAGLLLKRIVENVPMPSGLAYQLRYGNYVRSGYVDLRSEFVLSSVAPLLKPGIARYRSPEDVAGYETVYYSLKRRGEGGIRIELTSVEQNRMGVVTRARRPVTEVLVLPESMRYARYYFRMWSVGRDRKIALLAAASRELLEPASKKFETDPDSFCRSVPSARLACVSVPGQMMITPELRIAINGRMVYLPVGGTLGQALRSIGVKDQKALAALLPRLQVLRPYDGMLLPVEFDRSRGDIFGLVPIGGEQIHW